MKSYSNIKLKKKLENKGIALDEKKRTNLISIVIIKL